MVDLDLWGECSIWGRLRSPGGSIWPVFPISPPSDFTGPGQSDGTQAGSSAWPTCCGDPSSTRRGPPRRCTRALSATRAACIGPRRQFRGHWVTSPTCTSGPYQRLFDFVRSLEQELVRVRLAGSSLVAEMLWYVYRISSKNTQWSRGLQVERSPDGCSPPHSIRLVAALALVRELVQNPIIQTCFPGAGL